MIAHTPFVYLRHGETDWNASGLSQGRVEVALNAVGLEQAARAAAVLRGHGIGSIAASSLGRAQQTAHVVGEALGLAVHTDPDLREASFGDREGTPIGDWYDRWVTNQFTPDGGESFADLRLRARGAIDRALALRGLVLVVAHGAFFRAVREEMGLSAHVRTANGAAILCTPGEPAWTLRELD